MIRTLAYSAATLCIVLVLLEGIAFVAVQLVSGEDIFDSREGLLSRLNEEALLKFARTRADPLTGWRNIGPKVRREPNCLHEEIEYHYNVAGGREHDWFDMEETRVIALGDSYTLGYEVGDSQAYPARLANILGVSVANHGVGGFGPTQALLSLERQVSRYPKAEVVVLGIMYENVYRMMNSYRPVLYGESSWFTLKPYMVAGQVVPHPGAGALASLEQFVATAEESFDLDFWAKPVAGFPYLVALGRGLSSNYTYYRKFQREFRKLGIPEYFLIYDNDEVELNLVALLNEYVGHAVEWGLQPVAVFIPRNSLDTASASKFIDDNRHKIDSRLLLGDVARSRGIDWEEFNLREAVGGNICHPSPYGYQVIADYVAGILHENKVWARGVP